LFLKESSRGPSKRLFSRKKSLTNDSVYSFSGPKEALMEKLLTAQNKAILASYARSVLGAGVATYVSTQDIKLTLNALWAAALPVIMRYLNPGDKAFGKGAEVSED
jgi:hypothetical protein